MMAFSPGTLVSFYGKKEEGVGNLMPVHACWAGLVNNSSQPDCTNCKIWPSLMGQSPTEHCSLD